MNRRDYMYRAAAGSEVPITQAHECLAPDACSCQHSSLCILIQGKTCVYFCTSERSPGLCVVSAFFFSMVEADPRPC